MTKPISNKSSSNKSKVIKSAFDTCSQTTKKNKDCKNPKAEGSDFCKTHSRDSSQFCNHKTKKGTKCQGIKGSCKFHSKGFVPGSKKKASGIPCGALNKKNERCGHQALEDSDFCFAHSLTSRDICGQETKKGHPCMNPLYTCQSHPQPQQKKKQSKPSKQQDDDQDDMDESEEEEEVESEIESEEEEEVIVKSKQVKSNQVKSKQVSQDDSDLEYSDYQFDEDDDE